jgi:hypothetical protein
MAVVSPSQDLHIPYLLSLTDIYPPFAAFGSYGCLNSLAVLCRCLASVPSLVPVVDTLKGDSTACLNAFRIDTGFFYTFSDNSEALGKSPILEARKATSQSSNASPEAGAKRWAGRRASVACLICDASRKVTVEAIGWEAVLKVSKSIMMKLY